MAHRTGRNDRTEKPILKRADGSWVIAFTTALPYGELDGRHVWYPVVLFKDQTEVSRSEIEALLRHLWHGELEIPDDLPTV